MKSFHPNLFSSKNMATLLKIIAIAYFSIAIYGQGIYDGKKECMKDRQAILTQVFNYLASSN